MSEYRAVFSANRIAQFLADSPSEAILPTPEQRRIIEQPLGGSVLVLAGAGSGKTETMANRVVWLVANGLVQPSQILGLTFTRKAAGELGERVVQRLDKFGEALANAKHAGLLREEEHDQAQTLIEVMEQGLELPEVSTYNSFASSVVQEFGALAGVAASPIVIDDARAWGIARDVVISSDDPELVDQRDSVAVMVKRVLKLDHAVSDNLTSFNSVARELSDLERLSELPYNVKKKEGSYAIIQKVLADMRATSLTVRLARRFAEEKRRRGLIEFSDQLAMSVETLRRSSEAVRVLRARTPVVLLDEVQDTSVGQTSLLATIFRGSSVMAVGDPHQSIYGFRGASASNLQTFHRDFRAPDEPSQRETTLSLSVSWRNPSEILHAANVLSAPLAKELEKSAEALSVKTLSSRAEYTRVAEDNRIARVDVLCRETVSEEFQAVAEWMRDAKGEHLARTGKSATAAVVLRKRSHMGAMSEALWQAGVPNRIVGIGGLLTTPEVTDLISTLRCLWFADADNELIRVLAGPRFRIGVSDLQGLSQAARWFSLRDHTKKKLTQAEVASMPSLTDPERQFTLLDTIDEISGLTVLDHRALENITAEGKTRLREAGQMLRGLRQEVGGDVAALIRSVAVALRLDIELDAAEHTGFDGSAVARANLESFSEVVDGFLASEERATLASLLDWLERATVDDQIAEHVVEPDPTTVQLITVHGSKGLEWDLVAIPRLVSGEFPSNGSDGIGWLRPGELPDSLRGDASARPQLDLSMCDTQQEVRDAIARYQEKLADKQASEERRLGYVAVTRAASRLLLSHSFWGGQTKPREPSVFLKDLASAKLIAPLQEESEYEQNPLAHSNRTLEWPQDPLGRRRFAVQAAAESLRLALAEKQSSAEGVSRAPLHPVVELLLAERASEHTRQREQAALDTGATHGQGSRLTASTFHEFIEDPIEAEKRRLRPLPTRPYRRTRTGNLFHEWVERRSSTSIGKSLTLFGLDDDASDEHLSDRESFEPVQEDLQDLIQRFERSRWADLQPLAVELEITMPFAGQTLVCKLDAVYEYQLKGQTRYEIVDWKSGRSPKTAAERSLRFLQLDLYRHAYATWASIDPEMIDVTLFYVAESQELRGEVRRSLAELEHLWQEARALTNPVRT